MKQIAFRYGLYAALVIIILGAVDVFIVAKNADYGAQEIAGYLSILLSMIFVFLGIRYFRNHVNGGVLSFGQGLKTGLLIVLIPSVFFGLFDLLYTRVINPGWHHEYYSHYIGELKKNTAPEKLEAAIKKAEQQKELFSSPVMEFLLMAVTVFIIGFIVTIISTLALRRARAHVVS